MTDNPLLLAVLVICIVYAFGHVKLSAARRLRPRQSDDFRMLEQALFGDLAARSAGETKRRASALAFLEKAHRACAAELARANSRAANTAAEAMRRLDALPDTHPTRIRSRAIGLTQANATAVLLANPQRTFDLMWERTIETAVRSYGTEATRGALRELGFTSTHVPSGY